MLTIRHQLLCQKLQYYGIYGLVIYLKKDNVCITMTLAQLTNYFLRSITRYILHSNHLLFLLYVNDIANVRDILSFVLFAEDTSVFIHSDHFDDITNKTNCELNIV